MDWGFVLGALAAFLSLAMLATLVALLNLRTPPKPPERETEEEPRLEFSLTAPADMADDEAERVSILVAALIAGRVRNDSGNFTASLLAYRAARDVLSVVLTADNPLRDLDLLEHAEKEMRG